MYCVSWRALAQRQPGREARDVVVGESSLARRIAGGIRAAERRAAGAAPPPGPAAPTSSPPAPGSRATPRDRRSSAGIGRRRAKPRAASANAAGKRERRERRAASQRRRVEQRRDRRQSATSEPPICSVSARSSAVSREARNHAFHCAKPAPVAASRARRSSRQATGASPAATTQIEHIADPRAARSPRRARCRCRRPIRAPANSCTRRSAASGSRAAAAARSASDRSSGGRAVHQRLPRAQSQSRG